jgi:hypothetical protein
MVLHLEIKGSQFVTNNVITEFAHLQQCWICFMWVCSLCNLSYDNLLWWESSVSDFLGEKNKVRWILSTLPSLNTECCPERLLPLMLPVTLKQFSSWDAVDLFGAGELGNESPNSFLKSAVFWGITQRRVEIVYRCFRTMYRSHPHGSRVWVGKKSSL